MIRLLAFFILLLPAIAFAQEKDKSYRDWTVYTTTLQGKKACYIASFPKSKTGTYTRRDEPYLLVTRISPTIAEVSTSSGYRYQKGSYVTAKVDNTTYKLFTKGELAWATDAKQDASIVDDLKKGSQLLVRGTSIKGTYSKDKYSLMGFTGAFERMNTLCSN